MSDRRSFIRNTILTAAAAGFTGKYAIASADPKTTVSSTFRYRTLGKTGIQLPIVSLGTGNTTNPALVRAALDKGLKLLAILPAVRTLPGTVPARSEHSHADAVIHVCLRPPQPATCQVYVYFSRTSDEPVWQLSNLQY